MEIELFCRRLPTAGKCRVGPGRLQRSPPRQTQPFPSFHFEDIDQGVAWPVRGPAQVFKALRPIIAFSEKRQTFVASCVWNAPALRWSTLPGWRAGHGNDGVQLGLSVRGSGYVVNRRGREEHRMEHTGMCSPVGLRTRIRFGSPRGDSEKHAPERSSGANSCTILFGHNRWHAALLSPIIRLRQGCTE